MSNIIKYYLKLFKLIYLFYRSHLERIYNQSLNKSKSKLSINKELKMLQQENSQSQNFTKDQNNNRSPTKVKKFDKKLNYNN